MITKKILCFLISAFFGAIVSLHGEIVPVKTAEHHLIHKIVENQKYCVASFDGDKIFIRSENIISTNQGLFINLNGSEFYPIPLLQFNKQGHFMQASFARGIELAAKKEETRGPCPECGMSTNKYGICKNIQCFFYGLRVL